MEDSKCETVLDSANSRGPGGSWAGSGMLKNEGGRMMGFKPLPIVHHSFLLDSLTRLSFWYIGGSNNNRSMSSNSNNRHNLGSSHSFIHSSVAMSLSPRPSWPPDLNYKLVFLPWLVSSSLLCFIVLIALS